MTKITVKDTEVNVVKVNGEDYICLTDSQAVPRRGRRALPCRQGQRPLALQQLRAPHKAELGHGS